MFLEQTGVAGDKQIQKRDAEGRIGEPHFALILSMDGKTQRQSEERIDKPLPRAFYPSSDIFYR
jgi:hypothetical protein